MHYSVHTLVKLNAAIRFLNYKNIERDTKFIILSGSFQELWLKSHFTKWCPT